MSRFLVIEEVTLPSILRQINGPIMQQSLKILEAKSFKGDASPLQPQNMLVFSNVKHSCNRSCWDKPVSWGTLSPSAFLHAIYLGEKRQSKIQSLPYNYCCIPPNASNPPPTITQFDKSGNWLHLTEDSLSSSQMLLGEEF